MVLAVLLVVGAYGVHFLYGWYGSGPLVKDATFSVPEGATLASVSGAVAAG